MTAAMTLLITEALADTVDMRSSAQELEHQVIVSCRKIERRHGGLIRARDETVLDLLARLLNRKGLDQEPASMPAQPPAPGSAHCLIMLDINVFKLVNDTRGHVMGDRIIQTLGEMLRSCVADKAHSVARHGGEQFSRLLSISTLDFDLAMVDTVRLQTRAINHDRQTQEVVLTVSISTEVALMRPCKNSSRQGRVALPALQDRGAGRFFGRSGNLG